MSRALKTLRNWARKMADGEQVRVQWSALDQAASHDGPAEHRVRGSRSYLKTSHPSERALWLQIANEIDAFLNGDSEVAEEVCGQEELPGVAS